MYKLQPKLSHKHFVPQWYQSDEFIAKGAWYKFKSRWLLPILHVWVARRAKRYFETHARADLHRLVQLQKWMGGWSTTPRQNYDSLQVIQASAIPQDLPKNERVLTPDVTPFFFPTRVVEAYRINPKRARFLAMTAGGIGDLIIFSQLFRRMRREHDCEIDIGHVGSKYSDDFLQKLFAPARVVRFPVRESEFARYQAVLPTGMYRVMNGDSLSNYMQRMYRTPLVCSGFDVDDATEEDVRRRLIHVHGLSLDKPLVVVHAGCRPTKNYPHFDAVAKQLVARGHQVLVVGELSDSALTDEPGKLANACGWPLWRTLVAMRSAQLFVGPDSSFMHAAAAWNIPSLAVFGPTPLYWSSSYPRTTAVTYERACELAPCWMSLEGVPPCGETRNPPCLAQIPAATLVQLAEDKLRGAELGAQVMITTPPARVVRASDAANASDF